METDLKWILERRSVRSFTGQSVDQATLEKIIRAGMAAPSAVNQQMWEFVVVDERAVLNSLCDALPYAKMLTQAPAAIIVAADLTRTFNNDPQSPFWIMDCSAATENILLAIHALGLGAVWTAVYPNPALVADVRRILHLPENIVPLNVVPLGHPADHEPAKDKWKPNLVHWNGW